MIASPPKKEAPEQNRPSASGQYGIALESNIRIKLHPTPPISNDLGPKESAVKGNDEKTKTFFSSDEEESMDKIELKKCKAETKSPYFINTDMLSLVDNQQSTKGPRVRNSQSNDDISTIMPSKLLDDFSPRKKQKVEAAKKDYKSTEVAAEPNTKRKRGRPKKNEQVRKEVTIVRKSLRIIDKPETSSRLKTTTTIASSSKPLKVMNIDLLFNDASNPMEGLHALNAKKSLTLGLSSIGRPVYLNTLDVLLQLVKEFSPKPKMNDIINESVTLSEYKLHLVELIKGLRQTQASVMDISNDIAEVQRKKNKMRSKIMDLKKQQIIVASKISSARSDFEKDQGNYLSFMASISSLERLKQAIETDKQETNFSSSVAEKLDHCARFYDSEWGFNARLKSANAILHSMLEKMDQSQ